MSQDTCIPLRLSAAVADSARACCPVQAWGQASPLPQRLGIGSATRTRTVLVQGITLASVSLAVQVSGTHSGLAQSWAEQREALRIAPREAAVSWQSERVSFVELPDARVHAPLAVSAERGVACALVGVQRAIILDLVRPSACPSITHILAALNACPSGTAGS